MKPTARLNLSGRTRPRDTGLSASQSGLSQSSYDLWYYVDLQTARNRILRETSISRSTAPYMYLGMNFGDNMAEEAKQVVNQNGGNARIEEGWYDPSRKPFGKYKLCVVESKSSRADVDRLMEQFKNKAAKIPYSGVQNENARAIVFEELVSSRSKPDLELIEKNQFNPKPGFRYGPQHPVVHWKNVTDEGGGSGQLGGGTTYPVKRLEGTPPRTVVVKTGTGFSAIQPFMDELRGSGRVTLGFKTSGGNGGAAYFTFTNADGPDGREVALSLQTPVPALLQEAARQGALKAKLGQVSSAIPPSEVPSPGGSGGGGNRGGGGGNGGGNQGGRGGGNGGSGGGGNGGGSRGGGSGGGGNGPGGSDTISAGVGGRKAFLYGSFAFATSLLTTTILLD
jgi:hypothetical protein